MYFNGETNLLGYSYWSRFLEYKYSKGAYIFHQVE